MAARQIAASQMPPQPPAFVLCIIIDVYWGGCVGNRTPNQEKQPPAATGPPVIEPLLDTPQQVKDEGLTKTVLFHKF